MGIFDENEPVEGEETESTEDSGELELSSGVNEDEETPEAPAKGSKLSADELLADLKERVEKGEIKGDALAFTQPKVQSSLAGRFNAIRKEVNATIDGVAKAKGVTLPEGKTAFDLMSEGGDAWLNLQRAIVEESLGPIKSKMSQEETERLGAQKLNETVNLFPEFKQNLPEIVSIIVSDPLMKQFSEVPEAIPLLVAGVGRDLQWQRAQGKLAQVDSLVKENETLKAALKKAGIAIKTGGETSKAKGKTPGKATGGKVGLESLLERNFDKLMGRPQ